MNDNEYMEKAISFAKSTNKIWPFSAVLVDNESGKILMMATDAAHISPIFHAESHCVHLLATRFSHYRDSGKEMTLYTTCECDPLSLSSLVWANFLGFSVVRVVFGVRHAVLYKQWGWGEQISSRELNKTFTKSPVTVEGPLMEDECMQLFHEAYLHQKKLRTRRPGVATLSNKIDDFSKVFHLPDNIMQTEEDGLL